MYEPVKQLIYDLLIFYIKTIAFYNICQYLSLSDILNFPDYKYFFLARIGNTFIITCLKKVMNL
ncbi:Uncharacterized protein dnl_24840 [Desulfonema limicola]|uniref:Uncharacterized protein n=1 Tax=Desulfonema limicola TaxID=45656 RepID=A0A975B7D6_9BACT|nr:Uncharacterized protein dnl_24840 [Desulfonema limicola]